LPIGSPKKKKGTISLVGLEHHIKDALYKHLLNIGFAQDPKGKLIPPNHDKESIRLIHSVQRRRKRERSERLLLRGFPELLSYFASGQEVSPKHISPRLELIESHTEKVDLFRLATLTWSIPVSEGFGRRMRFLVWDESNGKLIGIFGLTDPVFNLRARDEWIGWNAQQRRAALVHTMDAYVVGAVPPYSFLLGGKLVASLIASQEIFDDFRKKISDSKNVSIKK